MTRIIARQNMQHYAALFMDYLVLGRQELATMALDKWEQAYRYLNGSN